MVTKIDVVASFGRSGVVGNADGRLAIYEKWGQVSAEHAKIAKDPSQPTGLLDRRCGGDVLGLACEERSSALLCGAAADGREGIGVWGFSHVVGGRGLSLVDRICGIEGWQGWGCAIRQLGVRVFRDAWCGCV